ncbi:hypothetical protein A2392_02795 [Candidatus Kaiserbacteria bacterium RIFOXYB1_FULL_46_14]|uniref:Uncharacterized protein n=1 Tax=Candidatus Kaiserbacteria bacterium RIFOXYB1_FULL_46_14 TaxID=1798531 RepID=A0A1F6FIK8_9BACT|nr:MAG: hypothetical protein A2392_02795 [Candidatus Kaiserbacteria bacterium RIFOXYB1_FULL_46_14]
MLEELRKKPKGIRNLYAFWGAAILTLVIGFVWVLSLSTKFDKIDTSSFKEVGDTTGAFSQFIKKTKLRFSNDTSTTTVESSEAPLETSTSSPQVTPPSASSSKTQLMIATTTSEKAKTGTSTPVAN